MKNLTWKETLELAHILSNLDNQPQEVPRAAELLEVERVEYNPHKRKNLLVYDGDLETPYAIETLFFSYGASCEVWTRLIIRDIDMIDSPFWLRDDDLSAMLLQNKSSDYGVFYHRYDEGNVEFKVVSEYAESFYTPFGLLQKMLDGYF